MFNGPEGGPLRRSNFNRRVWLPACAKSGLQGLRFHDLRHTGNTLAAATGASTKELMARMGHSSSRAALIYQHATLERDRVLADALSKLVESIGEAPARNRGERRNRMFDRCSIVREIQAIQRTDREHSA